MLGKLFSGLFTAVAVFFMLLGVWLAYANFLVPTDVELAQQKAAATVQAAKDATAIAEIKASAEAELAAMSAAATATASAPTPNATVMASMPLTATGSISPIATPTSTAEITAMEVAGASSSATPTVTATSAPVGDASIEIPGEFKTAWESLGGAVGSLGLPAKPAQYSLPYAFQPFRNADGIEANMIWVAGFDMAFATTHLQSGGWRDFDRSYLGTDQDVPCPEAPNAGGGIGVKRGFGRIWCDPNERGRVSNPTSPEKGYGDGIAQPYAKGWIIYLPHLNQIWVLHELGVERIQR